MTIQFQSAASLVDRAASMIHASSGTNRQRIVWIAGALLLAAALGLAFAQYLSPEMLNEIATLAMCV
jgi:uncharacterized membrane protein YfcA